MGVLACSWHALMNYVVPQMKVHVVLTSHQQSWYTCMGTENPSWHDGQYPIHAISAQCAMTVSNSAPRGAPRGAGAPAPSMFRCTCTVSHHVKRVARSCGNINFLSCKGTLLEGHPRNSAGRSAPKKSGSLPSTSIKHLTQLNNQPSRI